MILIDYNQVFIANFFASVGNHLNVEIEEDLLRHMFLNRIRSIRNKFSKEYGEVVICGDSKKSWRKDIFPYYKASRKKSRDESEIDWNSFFAAMDKIRNEMRDIFPYKVMVYEGMEADDIIGVLCNEFGSDMELDTGQHEKILIISTDKDFIQLQKFSNVEQYNPVKAQKIIHPNPKLYLKEHIIRGDKGDGIPNVLSEDNVFMIGKRQTVMTQKRFDALMDGSMEMTDSLKSRISTNIKLIDLSQIPTKYVDMVIEDYQRQDANQNDRRGLMNYFIKHKLTNLLPDIGDF